MRPVLIATSNAGKLRDFAGVAAPFSVIILGIPNFSSLPEAVEDGLTFEANARKKAAQYSLHAPGEIVLADDSGLEVDALHGAPGVHSARYSALEADAGEGAHSANSSDNANNARLLSELSAIPLDQRTARFVCVLAAARDGEVLAVFSAKAEGLILDTPRGTHGFGYDPLFFFPRLNKTFAELTPEEKAQVSHRGAAFRKFLEWNKYRES
jgi:XTP/dITP diphosphohydrolase